MFPPPDDGFPRGPLIQPVLMPLVHDPISDVETPESQKLFPTQERDVLQRLWGQRYPTEPADPSILEEQYARTFPSTDPERCRYWDVSRCLQIDETQIVAAGAAFEGCRMHLQKFGVGVIERIITTLGSVTALDALGVPVFDFGPIDGDDACIFPLQHPDPLAGTLQIAFRLVRRELPDFALTLASGVPAPQVAVPIAAIPPENVIPPWDDMRYGGGQFSTELKYLVHDNVLVSLYVILTGTVNRWRVHANTRLAGYWNAAGLTGEARSAAKRRW